MLTIPSTLRVKYDSFLKYKNIPAQFHGVYKKWLQYYLDFCRKYEFDSQNHQSLHGYIKKLRDKNQTESQQSQANQAITLYYQLSKNNFNHETGIE